MPGITARLLLAAGLIFISAIATACSDNPVDGDDDHAEAERINLLSGGVVHYSYDAHDGEVDCDAPPCNLTVASGQQSDLIEILFVSLRGTALNDELTGDEYEVRVETADEAVAVAHVSEGDTFAFRLEGVEPGTTELRVWLMHNQHEDLSTPPYGASGAVPVIVTE